MVVYIQIPPLKVRRHWYKLDKMYVDKLAEELNKQLGDSERLKQVRARREGVNDARLCSV